MRHRANQLSLLQDRAALIPWTTPPVMERGSGSVTSKERNSRQFSLYTLVTVTAKCRTSRPSTALKFETDSGMLGYLQRIAEQQEGNDRACLEMLLGRGTPETLRERVKKLRHGKAFKGLLDRYFGK